MLRQAQVTLRPRRVGVDPENWLFPGQDFSGTEQEGSVASGRDDDVGPVRMLGRVVVPLNDPGFDSPVFQGLDDALLRGLVNVVVISATK